MKMSVYVIGVKFIVKRVGFDLNKKQDEQLSVLALI